MRLTAATFTTTVLSTAECGGHIITFLEKEISQQTELLKDVLLKKKLNPGKKCKWFDGTYLLIHFEELFYINCFREINKFSFLQ